MRILLHCTYYPPEVGGLESHVAELARGLVEEGHRVHVVTSRSRPDLSATQTVDGVEVVRTWFPSRTPPGWIAHALASIPATRRLAREADVVHAQAFASIVPARVAARSAGIPLVSTLHTSHFLVRAGMRHWKPILRRLVESADHTLAASDEIAEVGEGLRRDGGSVEALVNGVDTRRFQAAEPLWTPPPEARPETDSDSLPDPDPGPDAPTPRVVVVPRRLFRKNGVEYVIRALPALVREVPGALLLLVGDGPERDRIEALARELGVSDRIHLAGRRPHHEMPGWLSSGEIAVFPSLMEATSVAALEAMACRRPVVASRVGGLPQIVDEEVGRLVEPANPEALARALADLLRDPNLAERGRRARARVEAHWSNARLVRRHLEVYRALVEGTPVPSPATPQSEPGPTP